MFTNSTSQTLHCISWYQSPTTFLPWCEVEHVEKDVTIGYVYECDEATGDEQLEARLQRMEEWFDWFDKQFDALADQITALAVANGRPINQICILWSKMRIMSVGSPSIHL